MYTAKNVRRFLVIITALALISTSLAVSATQVGAASERGPQSAPSAPARDEERFYELLAEATAQQPVFGPISGWNYHYPNEVTLADARVSLSDFAAHIECDSPGMTPAGYWDCGFKFRDFNGGPHYRLIVFSDGNWHLTIGNDELIHEGSEVDMLNPTGATMTIDLVVDGAVGYLAIDSVFVSVLDLSAIPGPGGVGGASAFYNETHVPDGITVIRDFAVWSLDGLDNAGGVESAGNVDDEFLVGMYTGISPRGLPVAFEPPSGALSQPGEQSPLPHLNVAVTGSMATVTRVATDEINVWNPVST